MAAGMPLEEGRGCERNRCLCHGGCLCRAGRLLSLQGNKVMSEKFNLTLEMKKLREHDIAEAHKIVAAIKRCWLIEAELFSRLHDIEQNNNMRIYDTFGSSSYLQCRDLRESAGERSPFLPQRLWDYYTRRAFWRAGRVK